jgi:hypothetical protein
MSAPMAAFPSHVCYPKAGIPPRGSRAIGGGGHCELVAPQHPLSIDQCPSQWQRFPLLTAIRRLTYLLKTQAQLEEMGMEARRLVTMSLKLSGIDWPVAANLLHNSARLGRVTNRAIILAFLVGERPRC